jgi:hypothetical protein
MGILKVDTVQDQDGNDIIQESAGTVTVGQSGQTVAVAGGATLSVPTLLVNGESVTAITLPTVTSLSPDTIENTQTSVTITGTNFVNGAVVNAISTTGAIFTADTVTFNSATSITAQFTLATDGTYYIRVENPDGLAGRSSTALLTVSDAPTWSTAAGSLGSMAAGSAGSFTVTATSDSAITYSKVSGDFPGGLTLNSSTGEISGTESGATADTTYNFTIRATDAEGQTADRAFSITVDVLYVIDNSLRFNDDDAPVLERIPSTSSNQKTFTYSFWVKRANISTVADLGLVGARVGSTLNFYIEFENSNQITSKIEIGGVNYFLITNALYRDPLAWYHIAFAVDTTQATASNRVKLYVNGEQVTSFSTEQYPPQNGDTSVNIGTQYVGAITTGSNLDGYMAEVCLIDGQQLDPTSFGEFDANTNIWIPKPVSGLTFGTNGFYLPFENSAALGQDDSGNGNDFTVYNLTSIDQTTDTPTNNYCTLNPLNFGAGTLSEGNLKWAASGNVGNLAFGTIGIDMGVSNQFYWETKVDSIGSGVVIGIAPTTLRWNDTGRAGSYGYFSNGNKYLGTSPSAYGSSFTTGDTIGVLAGNGSITFYKNGVSQGVAWSGLSETYLPFLAEIGNTNSMNFGSPPYTISSGNTDPAGYGNFEYSTNGGYALNTTNLAEYG